MDHYDNWLLGEYSMYYENECPVCGEHHEEGEVPFTCENGDGE